MHAFWVPGIAEPQGSVKGFVHPRIPGRVILTSDNPDLKRWRRTVALAAQGSPTFGVHEPVWLRLTFHMPAPLLLPKGRSCWPTTIPDADKLTRAIMDSLTFHEDKKAGRLGIYPDDSQVVEVRARKVYAGPHGPGVRIVVSEVPFGAEEPKQPRLLEVGK